MAGSFHESAASKKERKKQVSGGQQAQEYGKAYKMHLLTCENIPQGSEQQFLRYKVKRLDANGMRLTDIYDRLQKCQQGKEYKAKLLAGQI